MTENKRRCILDDKRKGGCGNCGPRCAHAIAMSGLNGEGGRIGSAGLPAEYRNVTLANSPARTEQAKAYAMIERYVPTFDRQFETDAERIKSLYLWSESPGTGKTTTASAILNEWIVASYVGALKRGVQPIQAPAYFLDVNKFQELYTGFTRPNIPQDIAEANSRPYYRQMEKARLTPFVVLDDLGVRGASDGFRQDLHTIINYRCANGLPTIYTSNIPLRDKTPKEERVAALKPYDIMDVFDERLQDRVFDQCQTVHFVGSSNRGRR